ncbi:MAG: YfhO family protein [Acidobacteriota bacterium]
MKSPWLRPSSPEVFASGGDTRRELHTWPSMILLVAAALLLFWPLFLHRAQLVPFHVLAGDPALAGIDQTADRPDWRTYDLAPVTTDYAEKALLAHALRQGEFALWNPYNGLGMPLLADGQSQPLALFFLPFLTWPTPWVYSFCLVLQLLFAGVGMDRLLGELGCGLAASAMGTLLFAFNPYTLKFIAFSDVWAYAWYPWLFWAAERLAKRVGVPSLFALLTALMAMSGHPEDAFWGAASAFVYLVVRAWQEGGLRNALRPAILASPLLALFLSAWWVLPFLEWVGHSFSPRMKGGASLTYAVTAPFLLGSELMWLPPLLLLALAGAVSRKGLLLALAPALLWPALLLFPGPASLQGWLSLGFMSGRYTRSLAWFALAALAPLGLEAWARGKVAPPLRWAGALISGGWMAVALILLLHPSAAAFAPSQGHPLLGLSAAASPTVWLLVVLGMALWLAPARLLEREGNLASAALAACVVGGCLFLPPSTWALWNRSNPAPAPAVAAASPGDGLREWFPHEGLLESLSPNLSAAFAVRDIRYVSPLTPRRLLPIAGNLRLGFTGFLDWNPDVMDFSGVGLRWSEVGGVLRPEPNPSPLGRAFWVQAAQGAATQREAFSRALAGNSWRTTAYLEGWKPAAGSRPLPPQPAPADGARVTRLEDLCNRTAWRVASPAAGWLVLRDLYWPGWRATVDDRPVPIHPADGAFRAVRVEAGTHEVRFVYKPFSVTAGATLSLLGCAGMLGMGLWDRSRRKRGRHVG